MHPLFVTKEELNDLNTEWFSTELMFQLQSTSDPFSYEELEKHTITDNLEKYKKNRDEKLSKRRNEEGTKEESAKHKRAHDEETNSEEDQSSKHVKIDQLEIHDDANKAGVHLRPMAL